MSTTPQRVLRPAFEPPSQALDNPAVTDLERTTVRALRTKTGWWNGDARALDALRMFEAKIVERERNLTNAAMAAPR